MIERKREREREREAETQAEGEAGSMHREADVGFDPGSPGLRPGPKADTKPTEPLRRPHPGILFISLLLSDHTNITFSEGGGARWWKSRVPKSPLPTKLPR